MYTASDPGFTGRVTVPVLWDKKTNKIVNNDSSEIIRMFNSAFDMITGNRDDYYPINLRARIDEINDVVSSNINRGVYRCGFTRDQQAYDEAFTRLFSSLDKLEKQLGEHRYLAGSQLTEADWRLFTSLIRFDAVYYVHFKTNRNRIEDFRNLSAYLRDLYQIPGVAETVNFDHIKRHYYVSHKFINPSGIIPKGPEMNLMEPHGRDKKFSSPL